jgi:hypothetical protein
MAYIEGSNAIAPGDPIGLRINDGACTDAVVSEVSRYTITVETQDQTLKLDLRPCNEATWDKARRYLAEQAGAAV